MYGANWVPQRKATLLAVKIKRKGLPKKSVFLREAGDLLPI